MDGKLPKSSAWNRQPIGWAPHAEAKAVTECWWPRSRPGPADDVKQRKSIELPNEIQLEILQTQPYYTSFLEHAEMIIQLFPVVPLLRSNECAYDVILGYRAFQSTRRFNNSGFHSFLRVMTSQPLPPDEYRSLFYSIIVVLKGIHEYSLCWPKL